MNIPRRQKAIDFLQEKGIADPEDVASQLDEIGLDKIDRLVDGDITSNEKNYFQECFDRFIKLAPVWGQLDWWNSKKQETDSQEGVVHLFWTQFSEEQLGRIMVIRKQKSGLCYLHAPVVLEHYLIAIATNGRSSSTYNIGKYEAHVLTGNHLKDFLLRDEGGSSQNTLFELCELDDADTILINIPSPTIAEAYSVVCEEILARVAQSPALVSSFVVHSDFLHSDTVSFSGIPSRGARASNTSRHSMVLIGGRKTADGEYFFLLQNWWEGRYFIEVSAGYMHYCQASIRFVTKAIIRKSELSTFLCDALYAETSTDAPEKCYEQ